MFRFEDVRTARQQIEGFYRRTKDFVRENRHYGMFLGLLASESVELSDRVATALRKTMEVFTATLRGIIRYGQEKTFEFRTDVDANTLAQAMIASHLGAIIFFNLHETTASYDEMFRSLEKVATAGLVRRPIQEGA